MTMLQNRHHFAGAWLFQRAAGGGRSKKATLLADDDDAREIRWHNHLRRPGRPLLMIIVVTLLLSLLPLLLLLPPTRFSTKSAWIGRMQSTDTDAHQPPRPPLPHLALVVNLARRHDRWRAMVTHLNARLKTYTIERLNAVDGHRSLDFAQMVADGHLRQRAYESIMASRHKRVWGQEMTPGALGCLLSHTKAWERALHLNQSVLVLEDDVNLVSSSFELHLARALGELPFNFGLLYLGDMAKDSATIKKTPYSAHLERLSRPLWGTYAYVVSPLAARRLLLHMYPAEVQVDSYIQQVAQLYESDMLNFAAARDLVYTDNSEARDTDAQAVGGGVRDGGGGRQQDDGIVMQTARYHVILPHGSPPAAALRRRQQSVNHQHLTFDPSYPSAFGQPNVLYHDHESAIEDAVAVGLISRSQIALLLQQNEMAAAIWRWILCLAASMRHGGGLCFTEPFTIVRPIDNLLWGGVEIGVFMDRHGGVLPQVVYYHTAVSLLSAAGRKRRVAALLTDAAVAAESLAAAPSFNDMDDNQRLHALIVGLQARERADMITTLPSHLFDPLRPLQRPCRCDRAGGVHRRSNAQSAAYAACQSRCDRLVAPPYGAGYAARRVCGRQKLETLRLHHVGDPTTHSAATMWRRMHPSPTWIVDEHRLPRFGQAMRSSVPNLKLVNPLNNNNSNNHLRTFCAGLSAVAKHGGVYVDASVPPTRSLLHGVLANWSAEGFSIHGPETTSSYQEDSQDEVVMLWAEASAERRDGTHGAHRPKRKRLSWRFFAARSAGHPVAVRLSRTCERVIELIDDNERGGGCGGAGGTSTNDRIAMALLQLEQVVADDAWSIRFHAEQVVFQMS